jgi:hypothetical protein
MEPDTNTNRPPEMVHVQQPSYDIQKTNVDGSIVMGQAIEEANQPLLGY